MIIDYDHNQNLNTDRKLDSLKESVQMALNENDAEHKGFRALFDKVNATIDSIKSQIADILNRLGQDYIVEQGTSGIWTYRKWNSGIAECWGTWEKSVTGTSKTAPFSGYCYSMGQAVYPTNFFVAPPVVNVSGRLGSLYVAVSYSASYQSAVSIELQSNANGTYTCYAYIHAIGRWK